jgi:pyruvate,water dikinase
MKSPALRVTRAADLTPASGVRRVCTPAERVSLVRSLDECDANAVSEIGGKAASLVRLRAAGFSAPEGFVVTTDAFALFLSAAGLDDFWRALADSPTAEPSSTFDRWRDAVMGAALPTDLQDAMRSAVNAAGFDATTPLAVRSSGVSEDASDASFAGLHDSVLNVRGEDALAHAVRQCWASACSPRVLAYRRRVATAGGAALAVVVQRLVKADAAGVLFTVNPTSGDETETVIEAVSGFGEALVSGAVTPHRFVTSAATGQVRSRYDSEQGRELMLDSAGGLIERAARATRPLDDDALAELTRVGAQIQRELGQPVDIEWVRSGPAIFIVQARPVTTLQFPPSLGEWTTADFRDGGVSSGVCSPFMWSLYERAFDDSMDAYLRKVKLWRAGDDEKWSRMFFGRPYWNLSKTKRVLARVPGYCEREFDLDLGITPTYAGPGEQTPFTPRRVVGALPSLLALRRTYAEGLERNAAFLDGFEARRDAFDLTTAELGALPDAVLEARYAQLLQFQHETERAYFETIFNTSNSKLDFKVVFEKVQRLSTKRRRRDETEPSGGALQYATLVSGLKDLSHLRPMIDLWELLEARASKDAPLRDDEVRAFAARHKQHGRRELDIRAPRWPEDTPFVRELMERSASSHDAAAHPARLAEAQYQRYLAERQKARAATRGRPWLWASFDKKLQRVRSYAWWREELRDCSSWLYALTRQWTLEVARRLVARGLMDDHDQVWLLSAARTTSALSGQADATAVSSWVEAGEQQVLSFRNFDNPEELGSRHAWSKTPAVPTDGALFGIACSAGCVEGVARVATTIEEAQSVRPGEILVARFTDPGWTPLFGRLAGVATEVGGVLSHAAVISREYGIPAVLSLGGATTRVRTGDRVRLDGDRGLLTVLPGG